MNTRLPLWAASLVCVANVCGTAQVLTPIDFSSNHNLRMQTLDGNAPLFPEGNMTFGGVPFVIPKGGENVWSASSIYGDQAGSNPHTLTISVGIQGVDTVHTLMNTLWGSPAGSLVSIDFLGSGGLKYTVELEANSDIRDYRESVFSNSINGTTTREAFRAGLEPFETVRLDLQTFRLPDAFRTATLEQIQIRDYGAEFTQRIFVAGVTVSAVPEPESCVAFAGVALLGLAAWRRSRR